MITSVIALGSMGVPYVVSDECQDYYIGEFAE
jgi:hypothetical protein